MATYTENEYKGVSLKMEGVFITPDRACPTPSEMDGLDADSENMLRILGCESLQDAGKLLKLPQVAVACAQVLYHRFYFSKSFVRHNWEHYAMAAVFLSAKIEESCRRLRDVVNVFVHLRQLREQSVIKPLPIPEYAELKPHIIKAERRILKELGFCVHGKHPHKLICIYLHFLGQTKNIDLAQLSWNYMNDSLRTTVFACYHPETIACACIYLAAAHLQYPLGSNWFEIFNVSEDTIKTICLSILKLYSLGKPDVVELERRVAHLRKAQIEARNQKIAQDKKELQMQQDAASAQASLSTNHSSDNNSHSHANNSHSKSSVSRSRGDRDGADRRNRDRDPDGGRGNKENHLEKGGSHRRKTHKSRKSPSASPAGRYERRYRSRSPKKDQRDRSPLGPPAVQHDRDRDRDRDRDGKRNKGTGHKKYSDKEYQSSSKYRRAYDNSDDEYASGTANGGGGKRRSQAAAGTGDYSASNGGGGGKQHQHHSPHSSSSPERRYSNRRRRRSSSVPPASNSRDTVVTATAAAVLALASAVSASASASGGGGGGSGMMPRSYSTQHSNAATVAMGSASGKLVSSSSKKMSNGKVYR